jgi:dTDP-4-dehydrorhamnose reductase
MLGDAHVQLKSKDYLLVRESHKPYPFPYKAAWSNQYTNGDYVPMIAKLIVELISKDAKGIYNVGTEIKTWFNHTKKEFATQPTARPSQTPADITMNLTKLKNALKGINK